MTEALSLGSIVRFSALPGVSSVRCPAFIAPASEVRVAVACAVGYVLGLFQFGGIADLESSDGFSVLGSVLPQILPVRRCTRITTTLVMHIGLTLPMLDPGIAAHHRPVGVLPDNPWRLSGRD